MIEIDALFDKLGYVVLYLAVAVLGLGLVTGVVLKKTNPSKLKDFVKVFSGVVIGIAVAVLVTMTYVKMQDTDVEPLLFYPVLATLVTVLASGIALLVASSFGKKAFRVTLCVAGALALGCFIALMVCMSKQFDLVGSDYEHASTVGMIVSAVVIMALLVAVYILGGKKDVNNTRALVYGAVAVALSFALSYARLFKLPQGGSVTFASLLPLMIYCMMFGTRRGLLVCLVYGTLQALQDPYIIHPMQFLLDYPLAFGLIGVSGIFVEKNLFKNKIVGFVLGAVLAVGLRYACHVCSGVFAFADYFYWDSELMSKYDSAAVYSLAYNSFALVDMAIAIVAGSLMLLSKSFVNQMTLASQPAVVEESDDEETDDSQEETAEI
ncbi:MAG: energy-coupled thiamine transporter ThiT [Clostridia bacterium]|nr:energy-coupled thiamine transporter ThiT [Clostridia bacterium]